MKNLILKASHKIHAFATKQDGVTAIEYAIVAAGVAAVVFFIFGTTGPVQEMLKEVFTAIKTKVTGMVA